MYQWKSSDISRFATDIYWHQLDINQRCVSKSTSTYTYQIGVEVEYLKSKGHPPLPGYYIYGVFQWKVDIEMTVNVITQHRLHQLYHHPHNLFQHHTSRITLNMTPLPEFHAKSNVCIKTNVATFMGSWYIYGKLLHWEKCMVPINVTTHPQCTNGKSQNVWSRNW